MILLALGSCDKEVRYDYYVINQCPTNIEITVVTNPYKPNTTIFNVERNQKELIYQGYGINKLQKEILEHFFVNIIIKNDENISSISYVNADLWKFEPTSESHANCYLTINPEDFEQ